MKRFTLPILLLFIGTAASAQNKGYFTSITDTLASRYMAGRGYQEEGTLKAATFIRNELKSSGLEELWPGYFQEFNIPINTITGEVSLSIDGREFQPGSEFTVSSFSKGGDYHLKITVLPLKACKNIKTLKKFFKKNRDIEALLIDMSKIEDKDVKSVLQSASYSKSLPVKACVFLTSKSPGWHVARAASVQDYIVVNLKASLDPNLKSLKLSFGNQFHKSYPTYNVGAFIRGSQYPDSFLVFTAHYDHLGLMGDVTWFPGYNDNGSGTAMLLDMARHLSTTADKPAMSIAFLFLSAEETGLKGAYHAAANPPFPLKKVNSLVNLDMVGTGSEGITVVNASIYTSVYQALDSISKANNYLPEVASRGESPNSDHHAFHEKGVPAVFIYTRGKEYMEYHTIADKGPVPLTGYEGLFALLRTYIYSR